MEDNCCRYSADVCSPDGSVLVTFVAGFTNNLGVAAATILVPLGLLRNRQIIGILDLAPKEFTRMLAQSGLGDAEATMKFVLTLKKEKRFYLVDFE